MLQGRRLHENKTPWRAAPKGQHRKSIRFFNSHLQWRYALTLGTLTLSMVAVFAGTAWYFIQQNYNLFTRIAYDTHPGMVAHLERERLWIACLLILASLIAGLIALITALRITTVLLGPLYAMERHMQKAIRGDWSAAAFHVREKDDLRDIVGTYAYLYRTLRAQAEAELKMLEQIAVDPRQIQAMQAWENLSSLKRKQLGISDPVTSADFSAIQDSRRAS